MDVFISYKREEMECARAIADRLLAEGFSVWWDIDLVPGDKFADVITSFLDEARAAIVLWSELAVESDFVRSEANRANRRKTYIPVSLDGTAAPLGLDLQHCLPLKGWDKSPTSPILDPLVSAVTRRVGARRKSISREQQTSDAAEIELWKAISQNKTPDQLQYYINHYGAEGLFTDLAEFYLQGRLEPAATPLAPAPRDAFVVLPPPRFAHKSIILPIEGFITAAALLSDGRLLVCQSEPKDKAKGKKEWENVLLVEIDSGNISHAFSIRGGATGISLSRDKRFAIALGQRLGDSMFVDLGTMQGRTIGDGRQDQNCSNYPWTIAWESDACFVVSDEINAYRVTLDRYAGIAAVEEIYEPPLTRFNREQAFACADTNELRITPFGETNSASKLYNLGLGGGSYIESLHASPDDSKILIGLADGDVSSIHLARRDLNWSITANRQSQQKHIICSDVTFSWIDDDLIASCWEGSLEIIYAESLRGIYKFPDKSMDSLLSGKIDGKVVVVGWFTDVLHIFIES